jgi:hypothetical protein
LTVGIWSTLTSVFPLKRDRAGIVQYTIEGVLDSGWNIYTSTFGWCIDIISIDSITGQLQYSRPDFLIQGGQVLYLVSCISIFDLKVFFFFVSFKIN